MGEGAREGAPALFLPDEAATTRLGADIAMALREGDVLALHGDLGAGKSTLARGLIRALAGDPELEVPSPTFTLVQAYEGSPAVRHFDLYRLSDPSELDELGLEEAIAEGAVVIEWPERAEGRLPAHTVSITLAIEGEGRRATISGSGPAFERIRRSLEIRDFLHANGWAAAMREKRAGDASARAYEIVSVPGRIPLLLMNAPPLVPGPPVRDGRAYAEIARTARDVSAFVALAGALRQGGVRVPEILAADLKRGFLLIEHLGDGSFLDRGEPVQERYEAAAALLAMIHGRQWATHIEGPFGAVHDVPPFDREAMLIEVELLLDWYVPHVAEKPVDQGFREAYRALWNEALDAIAYAEQSIVLRDFHSPNIIWRGEEKGFERLGIIDFQDALIGPAAYDVASLAFDARVTVPPEIGEATLAVYGTAREAAGPFDREAFAHACAVMAAQRNSKILGIFVRLKERDGKPGYIRHLPRIRAYLARAFAHPALARLAAFYRENGLLEEKP